MTLDPSVMSSTDWKKELPTLALRHVTLREVTMSDLATLIELISLPDATRFGMEDPDAGLAARGLVERASRDRAAGVSVTYAITLAASRTLAGVVYARQLDPLFEAAECDCAILPAHRGTGVFLEAARLIGSFLFGSLGAHRIEARVPLPAGRGNGALKKLGAVQEGVLRRALRRGDRYVDQVLWSMLKEDWGDHWVPVAPRVH